MTNPAHYHDSRLTEQRNPATADIDVADAARIVELMQAEDQKALDAVRSVRAEIARAIDMVEAAFRAGGRLYYVGAGTSGRLGVLDASECPPTFGTDPELVQGIMAGGYDALVKSAEGAEDDVDEGGRAVEHAGANDVIFGIAASGSTPFVHGALARGRERGARTILLSCTEPPAVLMENVDLAIIPRTGPEALTGSTRLKAGTATKLVLNTVTTGAMIRWGRAYGNLMVDLRAVSNKLYDRSERIVMEVCGVDRAAARQAIADAGGFVKTAIVMLRKNVNREGAERMLHDARGFVRRVLGEPPRVSG